MYSSWYADCFISKMNVMKCFFCHFETQCLLQIFVHFLTLTLCLGLSPAGIFIFWALIPEWDQPSPSLSLAELLLFWYLGDTFTWKYNKNKCEPRIALFIFSRLKRSSFMIYPASYLWIHAVITAFSSFCAFKFKFQFCTSETLKIANADWYVLS